MLYYIKCIINQAYFKKCKTKIIFSENMFIGKNLFLYLPREHFANP